MLAQMEAKKSRYDAGIEKLQSAAIVVTETQEQLKNLQPELQQTSAETSALLAAIDAQRVDLDSKRTVSLIIR